MRISDWISDVCSSDLDEPADRRQQVEPGPAVVGLVRVHAPWHPEEPEDVLGHEPDVEPDEHRPERPPAERLIEHAPREEGPPVVPRGEDREHDAAYEPVVEGGDHEVGVVGTEGRRGGKECVSPCKYRG